MVIRYFTDCRSYLVVLRDVETFALRFCGPLVQHYSTKYTKYDQVYHLGLLDSDIDHPHPYMLHSQYTYSFFLLHSLLGPQVLGNILVPIQGPVALLGVYSHAC